MAAQSDARRVVANKNCEFISLFLSRNSIRDNDNDHWRNKKPLSLENPKTRVFSLYGLCGRQIHRDGFGCFAGDHTEEELPGGTVFVHKGDNKAFFVAGRR